MDRIYFVLALLTSALGYALMPGPRAQAAPPPTRIACPSAWPHAANVPLVSSRIGTSIQDYDTTAIVKHKTRAGATYEIPMEDDFGPNSFFCSYANGRGLLFEIPGKPYRCHLVVVYPDNERHPDYCTFIPTGDADKDTPHYKETEALTRDTAVYGARLSMTRAESISVSSSLKLVHQGSEMDTFFTPDGHQVFALYRGDLSAGAHPLGVQIRPPAGELGGMSDELAARFGFGEALGRDFDNKIWHGTDGTVLVLPTHRPYGNEGFYSEEAFLLDGKRIGRIDGDPRTESPARKPQ